MQEIAANTEHLSILVRRPGKLECLTRAVCLDMLMVVKFLMYTSLKTNMTPKNWRFGSMFLPFQFVKFSG